MTNLNKQKFKSPKAAYMGYLFQTFLKRPFGYIIAILYIVYLAVILVIVPAALHFAPLFIWNIGGFNMPIFNLFFIAGSAASIAVAVFRTGRDDGSDLNISAKPLTKGSTVFLKTAVYLLIMLAICLITVFIVSLVKPIFGTYDDVHNVTGIETSKYTGLVLSVLVGNLVNMLLFGGISVFISMIGGQVITIIGTVAIVFVMCLMNFLYPQVIKSSLDVLSDKYNADMLSYSCNTLAQIGDPKAQPYNFATIQCTVDDETWQEEYHFDTKKYWDIAEKESGRKAANYIDFGKQLSSLYNAFGLDESRLKEASKLVIGTNNSFNYHIDQSTWVEGEDSLKNKNYPVCFYTTESKLGQTYPVVNIIGGDMSLSTDNWFLYSTLFGVNFESINYVSKYSDQMTLNDEIWNLYKKPWNRMRDLAIAPGSDKDLKAVELYNKARDNYSTTSESNFADYAHQYIINDDSGIFFAPGQYSTLTPLQQYNITAQIHLIWAREAHLSQMKSISDFTHGEQAFPYSSKTVCDWYKYLSELEDPSEAVKNSFDKEVFNNAIGINGDAETPATHFSRLVTGEMAYAETFSNLYRYTVSSFYKITNIIAIWTVVSCCLFTGSVIVYKRTDFK